MAEAIYTLFVAFCLFMISICGFVISVSMWNKSKTICDKCKDEIEK